MNRNKAKLKTPDQIEYWQITLIRWFRMSGKNYPWRETRDPYAILVSELMLQQTQIRTVLERKFYQNWLKKFPDVESLAEAEEDQVLKAWEGLGYYNRARNLQKAAAHIVSELDGEFPTTPEGVLALPGVGPYTAGAVCSFAYNLPTPVVDGNVVRVFSRVFRISDPVDTSSVQKDLWSRAAELTPEKHARDYNSAIMELGQRICGKGNPKCGECPVAEWCLSENDPEAVNLPVKKKAVKITRKTEHVVFLENEGRILLEQEQGSRRKGLWKLPSLLEAGADHLEEIAKITYPITRYQVEMTVFGCGDLKILPEIAKKYRGEWFDLDGELPALGAPYLRAIGESVELKNHNL